MRRRLSGARLRWGPADASDDVVLFDGHRPFRGYRFRASPRRRRLCRGICRWSRCISRLPTTSRPMSSHHAPSASENAVRLESVRVRVREKERGTEVPQRHTLRESAFLHQRPLYRRVSSKSIFEQQGAVSGTVVAAEAGVCVAETGAWLCGRTMCLRARERCLCGRDRCLCGRDRCLCDRDNCPCGRNQASVRQKQVSVRQGHVSVRQLQALSLIHI